MLREEGHPLNWADDCVCDVAWDALSTDVGAEVDLVCWERDEEPMFVAPLATASPTAAATSLVKNVEDEAKKDSTRLLLWVTRKIKAVKKSVGTSL